MSFQRLLPASHTLKKHHIFLIFSCFIVLCYSNTFNASWHLDDEPNILNNKKLHLTELNIEQIKNAFTADPKTSEINEINGLYRPIPCFTFALNWYFGGDKVFGYHFVNIIIHLLCAWLVFLTLRLLLNIFYRKLDHPAFIDTAALLGALFWALSPIQTQSVTYIVQRMASMAALFTILAIFSYLQGRITATRDKYFWFTLCAFSFFAALGSKENSIMLPASLFLIEFSFFQHNFSKKQKGLLFLSGTFAFFSGILYLRYGLGIHIFSFLEGYNYRSFSLTERLLTEPRILIMYLSQIFLPIVGRLSIEHDIILSTSPLSPWTTLPAILIIITILIVSTYYLKKYPLFAFPIVFFFLNHLVESSVVPLELVFEHRNYLPSFFLFLPPALLITQALYGSNKFSPFGRLALIFCSTLYLIISGHATYSRNLDWATEGTLWHDAIHKAPESPRATHNLGRWYRMNGQYDQAFNYFQLTLKNSNKASTPNVTKVAALNGLASISYMLGNYSQSLQYFDQCLVMDKNNEACLKNRALAYLQQGLDKQALADAVYLSNQYPSSVEYQYITALSAYEAQDLKTAEYYLKKFVQYSLHDPQAMYLAGLILMKSDSHLGSLFFFNQAHKLAPDNIDYHFAVAACNFSFGKIDQTEIIVKELIKRHPINEINAALQRIIQFDFDNDLDKNFSRSVKKNLFSIIKTTE